MTINPVATVSPNEMTYALDNLIQTLNAVQNPQVAYVANATATAGGTLTAAQIATGRVINIMDMTGAGNGGSWALPTVALLLAYLQAQMGSGVNVVGHSWLLRVISETSGQTITVAQSSATDWTLSGTMTVAGTPTFRDFVCTLTSTTAATIQSVGTGTN